MTLLLACLVGAAIVNAGALALHFLRSRRRVRRLQDRQLNLQHIVHNLAQDVVRLEQAQAQYTSIAQALRTPSPRKAARAHANAQEQAKIEKEETRQLPTINTQLI